MGNKLFEDTDDLPSHNGSSIAEGPSFFAASASMGDCCFASTSAGSSANTAFNDDAGSLCDDIVARYHNDGQFGMATNPLEIKITKKRPSWISDLDQATRKTNGQAGQQKLFQSNTTLLQIDCSLDQIIEETSKLALASSAPPAAENFSPLQHTRRREYSSSYHPLRKCGVASGRASFETNVQSYSTPQMNSCCCMDQPFGSSSLPGGVGAGYVGVGRYAKMAERRHSHRPYQSHHSHQHDGCFYPLSHGRTCDCSLDLKSVQACPTCRIGTVTPCSSPTPQHPSSSCSTSTSSPMAPIIIQLQAAPFPSQWNVSRNQTSLAPSSPPPPPPLFTSYDTFAPIQPAWTNSTSKGAGYSQFVYDCSTTVATSPTGDQLSKPISSAHITKKIPHHHSSASHQTPALPSHETIDSDVEVTGVLHKSKPPFNKISSQKGHRNSNSGSHFFPRELIALDD